MSEIKEGDWIEKLFEEKNSLKCIKLLGFPESSVDKEFACNAGDTGSIPGLGRSAGGGKGYPLQYSALDNSMDCIVHGVPNSWTQLSNFHYTVLSICLIFSCLI